MAKGHTENTNRLRCWLTPVPPGARETANTERKGCKSPYLTFNLGCQCLRGCQAHTLCSRRQWSSVLIFPLCMFLFYPCG